VETSEAVRAYIAAISNPSEETADALAPHLADEVSVVGIVGPGSSRESVVAALKAPNASKLFGAAAWSETAGNAGRVVMDGVLPTGSLLGGLSVEIAVGEDGRIRAVGQSIIPSAGTPPSPVVVSEEMGALIDGALANTTPFILAYVDAEGAPHLSLRGTVQRLDEQRLGTWARDPNAGLPRALAKNAHVALIYRDAKARTTYTFSGRGHIATDEETRERVFMGSPEVERNIDGRRRGVAIVIELDSVEGGSPAGRVNMRRS
jgi:hypothetical protein